MSERMVWLVGYVDVIDGYHRNWIFTPKEIEETGPYDAHEILGSHLWFQRGDNPTPMTDRWRDAN
jgi:hypothetical protein